MTNNQNYPLLWWIIDFLFPFFALYLFHLFPTRPTRIVFALWPNYDWDIHLFQLDRFSWMFLSVSPFFFCRTLENDIWPFLSLGMLTKELIDLGFSTAKNKTQFRTIIFITKSLNIHVIAFGKNPNKDGANSLVFCNLARYATQIIARFPERKGTIWILHGNDRSIVIIQIEFRELR